MANLTYTNSVSKIAATQNQRAREGIYSMARRRWQEGRVYLRKSKKKPDAWWGSYSETLQAEDGTVKRVDRNLLLGLAGSKEGELTKPMAKRKLREFVDKANNYEPATARTQTIGKAS